ncbi:MAG TPA: 2-amino-4-hydroxy-6-hydroxymethyldihydropteridine diphosphokinase [Balneolales bacterium]|nr:2-amino-4-hydroxy-6-hydroxymethyldihydropteridine diphosphokinase [Balneolales bacterium]
MTEHLAVISLGSNIDPEKNVAKAVERLASIGRIKKKSTFIYTEPLLYEDQPKFLNGTVLLETGSSQDKLRRQLKTLEVKLGRIRTANKNGPRTIDLDIIVFDGKIVDDDYYKRDFLQKMVAEVLEF